MSSDAPAPRHRPHSRLSLARSLKLAQLLVFEKVVELGSVLAASRELAMTQPAVSKSIQELERHLQAPLFVRGKRGMTLTDFGIDFEPHAKTMLAELRLMSDGLNAWHSGTSGHLVVGTLITASSHLVPEAITHLRQAAPDVTVEVRIGSNATLFPALARGDLDIVVGYLPRGDLPAPTSPGVPHVRLSHTTLYDEPLCVITDRHHPLARRRKLALSELQPLEWVLPTPDSAAFAAVGQLFRDANLALPARAVHSVSVLTNIGLLARSPMLALMPRSAVEPFVKAGLVAILPLGGLGNAGTVGYSVRAGRPTGPLLRRFIEGLHKATGQAPARRR